MKDTSEYEVLSPEGVEELVKFEIGLRVTLTGGGKYRLYIIPPNDPKKAQSLKIFDTVEEAMSDLAHLMVLHGSMIIDPKKTMTKILETLAETMKGGKK